MKLRPTDALCFALAIGIVVAVLIASCTLARADVASFYHEPQRVACGGGRFNPEGMTAAHKQLPCGTMVKVTNRRNGRMVVVEINDRGPYHPCCSIDVSLAAARNLGMLTEGRVPVEIKRLSLVESRWP